MPRRSERRLGGAWWSVTGKTGLAKDLVISRVVVWFALLLWSVVVVGCSGSTYQAGYETIYLRNSTTGQVVACGPYKSTETSGAASASAERRCIDDYQRQGFVRVPVSE